jgi:hypothetical protein
LIVKPGSIEGHAHSGVIHVVSTRISSHRCDVLKAGKTTELSSDTGTDAAIPGPI